MYSRRRRSNNFLQKSEQSLLRARRDTEWEREEAARSQLQSAWSVPSRAGRTEHAAHGGFFRWMSRSLRRNPTSQAAAVSSRLMPSPSLGPLASAVRFNAISMQDVLQFLSANPDVLHHYIEDNVDVPTLKAWLQSKMSVAVDVHETTDPSPYSERHVDELRHRLQEEAAHVDQTPRLMHQLARQAAIAVQADGFTLFLIDDGTQELNKYTPGMDDFVKQNKTPVNIMDHSTPAALAAATGDILLIESIAGDKRFPRGFGADISEKERSGLLAPLPGLAVLELRRNLQHEPFGEEHVQTVGAMLSWFHIAISKLQLSQALSHQEELNSFLLDVTHSMFEDVFSQQTLISKVMVYAKSLMSAERVTFFTLEEAKKELVASLFDDGEVMNGLPLLTKRNEIRFPMDKGIAGHCASAGELVNVQDAYADPRFNQEVDRKTGYKSRGLLAYPVRAKGRTLGVLQVVNKIGGEYFNTRDEAAIRLFGTYCSLALYYGMMHDRSQKKELQLSSCQNMLEYHTSADPELVEQYVRQPQLDDVPVGFNTFEWAPGPEHDLIRLYLYMHLDLLNRYSRQPLQHLVAFVATVIKSYRHMPYHNAKHAFIVAHCMYTILKLNPTAFSPLEMMALLLACLCHDADHRGYSNTFAKASTSLGKLYKVSVMENHHFNTAAAILQRPGHDVLSELSSADRKQTLDIMYEAIIATDLAVYFQRRPKLEAALSKNEFNVNKPEHRRQFCSLLMTGCDLSSVCKLPNVVVAHTLALYLEFHEQGDNEKKRGMKPDPMMDRSKALNLPSDQINFVRYLCMPAYQIICKVFPNTIEMLDNVRRTLAFWTDIKTQKSDEWKPYPSWPNPPADL